jgi:hypothetical protein
LAFKKDPDTSKVNTTAVFHKSIKRLVKPTASYSCNLRPKCLQFDSETS